MGYAEYKSNMELGQVFMDVMAKIAEQGYGFVGPELMTWHENSQWINTYQGMDADGNGVEYVDLDEHIFNSISHYDRVSDCTDCECFRVLISLFALTEPIAGPERL